jgi:hypothetical protein
LIFSAHTLLVFLRTGSSPLLTLLRDCLTSFSGASVCNASL